MNRLKLLCVVLFFWLWKYFSLSRIWILHGESDGMEIRIANDEYIKMTLKHKITTLKNLTELRKMTLSDPKCDVKKSRDTLPEFFNMSKSSF